MSTDAQDSAEQSIVYVVDDDESMRTAVDMLLRSVGLRVEAFASAHDFLAFEKPDVPSCLILDVRLKGQSGLAVQEQIAAADLQLPIIFMTAYGDIAMSVKAMKAGAMDFLAKPFREQDMLDAVAAALARDERCRSAQRALGDLRSRYATLSAREREVMAFVASGLMNKQIAAEMNLSEITVKIHRGQAMKKMDARSLADFVRKAEALGINQPPEPAAAPKSRGT
ncbi:MULTISPECIES: response regulator transcription factor [Burkholderia cepacia complex]|jgi:FixJ family two-component response regulator|uniref:C4-dicarboxylate transport transcriptional regulatory protein DctR n=1 Tax=Burkholderia multivorans CGD2 TaxID=513052 RepID=B9BQR9_9BURK|nr:MULTISPECIES: response regulator [Burkholderia cepacia complex]EEE06964.1 C4-dicarboxylate transport transcriptional regulatory protein DctR [Burkholderia multivorans CGD2]EEE13091.1 C4-dicarboxylate transport transcriptional regulatory protein DctR [Burkholderia multivorans CGD2M]MBR8060392.1 response regulator transcription factor [Burkholderia dolosa]MBR8303810.1 response regulator transcription factor [Burkholderia dolosa]MBR8457978.1 response regulator transcription factor [Burkholderi